ncbi:MAG: glycosyltransferase family 2 protein [Candidatus Symbiothrix sp.]|jgi:glycosyltransferase involved in cell wall biosynthesis|nr:glycosyltransferase family 2 protein [Candidatus Symbiothrix sp.]
MKFSIVICTYNRAEALRQSLESAAKQDFPIEDFEIVVVDNNSPDATELVCGDLMHQYSNIRYFKEIQQGVSYGRNRGVNEARGKFIAFVDDDETINSNYVDELNEFFKTHPQAELCSLPVVPVFEAQPPKWLSPFTMRLITGAYDKGSVVKHVSSKDYPGTGHAVFKRDLFLKYGAFNTALGRKGSSLMGAEDKDFFLRLIQNGVACYYVPTAPIYHHISANKLTEDFFNRLTLAIGKSERVRTLSISKTAYYKRLVAEAIKWAASFILFTYYTVTFQPQKGTKLLLFRQNVTKGLLNN